MGNVTGTNAGAIVDHQNTDYNTSTFTNIYWCETDGLGFYGKRDTTNQAYNKTEAKTTEQFASGEVAYFLGEAWGQTIGTDAYPVLDGAKVYYGYISCTDDARKVYSNNTNASAEKPGHSIDAETGKCGVCDTVLVDIAIDKVTLKPGTTGIYFKGAFSIDDSVSVSRYGMAVSVYSEVPVADDSDPQSLWTTGANSVLISNILSTEESDAENAAAGKMIIYARAYVLLSDGTYIYGNVVEVTLQQLVMAIDNQWDSLTTAQQEAISAMYETFRPVMSAWNIPNLKAA